MHIPAPSHAIIGNWRPYFAAVCNRDPSYLAQTALPHVDFTGSFLDVGAGTMNDSRFALEAGFNRVEAIDGSKDAWQYAAILEAQYENRFRFINKLFSEFDFGSSRYDWIHSNFALPYFGEHGFREFVAKLVASVRDSGVFSGIFYGPRDQWRGIHRDFAFVTREEVTEMLRDLRIVRFEEMAFDGHLQDRTPKFWHYFRVIAKKSDAAL
jgi:tellurite methyltransferase